MIPTTAYAIAASTVISFPIVVALLRWPGRTIGFALALTAWVAAGWWAGAIVIGATTAGAIARRRCDPRRSTSCRRRGLARVGVLVDRAVVSWGGQGLTATGTTRA